MTYSRPHSQETAKIGSGSAVPSIDNTTLLLAVKTKRTEGHSDPQIMRLGFCPARQPGVLALSFAKKLSL